MSTNTTCKACSKKIMSLDYLECARCNGMYDIDCLAIPHSDFNTFSQEYLKTWICPECVCTKRKGGNTNTPVRSMLNSTYSANLSTNDSITLENDNFNNYINMNRGSGTLQESSLPTHTTRDVSSLKDMFRIMKEMSEEIQQLRQQSTQFEPIMNMIPTMNLTITTMSDTINKLNTTLESKETVITELRTSVKKLEDTVTKLSPGKLAIKNADPPSRKTTQIPIPETSPELPAMDNATQQSSVHQSFSQILAKSTSHSKVPKPSVLSIEKHEEPQEGTNDSGWTIVEKKKQKSKLRNDRTVVVGTGRNVKYLLLMINIIDALKLTLVETQKPSGK